MSSLSNILFKNKNKSNGGYDTINLRCITLYYILISSPSYDKYTFGGNMACTLSCNPI